jgi:hypothetical protein
MLMQLLIERRVSVEGDDLVEAAPTRRRTTATLRRPKDPHAAEAQAGVTLRAAELAMLLDGVDWQSAKRSRRYRRPATA